MRFSIITPSFRSSEWLRLCIASVADQGVALEHIVQDSCSDDGTRDWLPQDARVQAFIEKDQGMYDAVNRGLRRATGDILAYLNCDEQYLPGALAAVGDFFERHPAVEVLFADAVVVDPRGQYLCHRRACLPQKYHCWVSLNLAILTCATFFRRSLIDQRRLFFDATLKAVGDGVWVMKLIEENVPMAILNRFTSVSADTGDNLILKPNAVREQGELRARAPWWARRARLLIILHYRLRRLLAGHYHQKPFAYSLFTRQSPAARVDIHVEHPTFRWIRRPAAAV